MYRMDVAPSNDYIRHAVRCSLNHTVTKNLTMASHHDDAWILKPQIPAIYVKTVLNIAQARGLNPEELMATAGLSPIDLADPSASILAWAHLSVVSQVIERTGNNGLGFEVGLSLPLTTHGSLGYAMLCSGSLREAFDLLERFWRLRERGARMHGFDQAPWRIIELSIDLGIPEEARQALFDCLLTVFFRGSQLLLGENHTCGELHLIGPKPLYFEHFKARLPRVCYDMPICQFKIPIDMLDKPLLMSNADALRQAIAQCEREHALLGDDSNELLPRVREALVLREGGYPSQECLAEALNMSLRTFRRKLQAGGTKYQSLLESVRRRDALRLLETTTLNVQRVAEQLGYLNPGNFTRAFKLWTGMTPREYRGKQHPD